MKNQVVRIIVLCILIFAVIFVVCFNSMVRHYYGDIMLFPEYHSEYVEKYSYIPLVLREDSHIPLLFEDLSHNFMQKR